MASVKRTSVVNFERAPSHANNYLERAGLVSTVRDNVPKIEPRAMKIHALPLPPSLPRPEDALFLAGSPPPDRDVATTWPPS